MIKINKSEPISCSKSDFPKIFFKLMYESETSYYSNPSVSLLNYLLSLYKQGMDYYSKVNEKYVKFLTMRMNSIISLDAEIETRLKLLYLKNNIKNKLNILEKTKEKELLEKKLKEESKQKLKKFDKDINSNIIMIKIYLRSQRNNFIKKARDKLFKKYITNNSNINIENENPNITQNLKLAITPIKKINYNKINNDSFKHQIMIRTKGDSNMKQYFFPTQIFFDEDKNFLFKNNINVLKKEKKFNFEKMTKQFICRYSLSFNDIIQEYIKKIIELLDINYREKIKKYKNHCDAVSFYEMIINEECYKSDLIKNEIGLHEENINYLNELNDLKIETNDKLVEIIDRFKINSPIDNKVTNEIVNDYIYGILELFI